MKTRNFGAAVILITLTSLPCRTQAPLPPVTTTGKALPKASCSPASTAQNSQFIIDCRGMTKEQGKKMLEIVDKILKNQLDLDLVMEKLAEIQNASRPNAPAKTYFCDGMWQSVRTPGDSVLSSKAGGNDSDFLNMLSLFKNQQYSALLKTCLASIDSAPDWLTPRLLCGLAYAHLDDKVKARAMLREFEAKAGPSYDAAPCHDMTVILRSLLK